MIYRGSEDGFRASIFHLKCDNKGPTLILIKSEAEDELDYDDEELH